MTRHAISHAITACQRRASGLSSKLDVTEIDLWAGLVVAVASLIFCLLM